MNDPKQMGGCPGSASRQFTPPAQAEGSAGSGGPAPSQLAQWPVQLMLVPPTAPYFKDADVALVADCVPFAYADFHKDFLKGRPIIIACPKLDNLEFYTEKLTEMFKTSGMKSFEVMVMEVPCCNGLFHAAQQAKEKAGVDIPITVTTIGVRGENFGTKPV